MEEEGGGFNKKKHPWEKYILIFCNKTIKAVTNVIKIEM